MAWTIPLVGEWAYSWLFGEWNEAKTYQHKGIDFGTLGVEGLPVVAPTNMKIIGTGFDENGYGYYVKGETPEGLIVILGHLMQSALVGEGDEVNQGDELGFSGNTGNSTGPHLHLEVRENGIPIDPMPYLEGAEEPPEYEPATPGQAAEPTADTKTVGNAIVNTKDALKSLANFLTWVKEINYKSLFTNIGAVILGLLLLAIGLVMIAQTQAAQQLGGAVGKAMGEGIRAVSEEE